MACTNKVILKMRVLIATGSYPPMKCGIGDYTRELALSLIKNRDIKVAILTSTAAISKGGAEEIEVFPVIEKWSLTEIFAAVRVIRLWSPDIVHVQYPTQAYGKNFLPWVLPIVSFSMGKKVVQTWHEGYSRRHALFLLLKTLVPSGLIFVRPNFTEEILHPMLGWATWKKRSVFIPNASSIPQVKLRKDEIIEVKSKYLQQQKRLIVFFGFIYPAKAVELIFEIANPVTDQIVIAGEIPGESDYAKKIMHCATSVIWQGKVNVTGFLTANDIAKLLAVSDAVILPFRCGGGEWNTSIHGAILNGAFVISTSRTKNGYDAKRNIYFAKIDDVQEMRVALAKFCGVRRNLHNEKDSDEWLNIANSHSAFYQNLLSDN